MDWKPLHAAAYNADLEAVSRLLAEGARVDERDDQGMSALHWSCFRGIVGDQPPVVRALIEAGADPNAFTESYSAPTNCVMYATDASAVDVLKVLLEYGADLNVLSESPTPLMRAAQMGNAEICKFLLAQGADPTKMCGAYSAADYASIYGHAGLAKRLKSAAKPKV
jgi:ankyrin repeat protein